MDAPTAKQKKINHLKSHTNIVCFTFQNRSLMLIAFFVIILINLLIVMKLWKKIEITLKVWDVIEFIIIILATIPVILYNQSQLHWSFMLVIFDLILFAINGIIQCCIEIKKFNHDQKDATKLYLLISLAIFIIMLGVTIRAWIIHNIIKAIESNPKKAEHIYDETAKVTIPQINTEPLDNDFV
eukprot:515250_1